MTAPPSETLSLTCEWDRTRFELLDRRSAILQKFEDQGILSGFSLPDSPDLVVDLTDTRVVQVSLPSISLYEVSRPDRAVRAEDIIVQVGEILGVSKVQVYSSFQHLVPWNDPPEAAEAFETAARKMVPPDSLGAYDFALLFDGKAADGWTYQAEFGVITPADALTRLLRKSGRSLSYVPPGTRVLSGLAFRDRSFADISTFVDSRWTAPETVDLTDIEGVVAEATERANSLAVALDAWVHAQ